MINFSVKKKYLKSLDTKKLNQAALQIMDLVEHPSDVDVSIRIESDEDLQGLNRQYRGFDQPTDVLSFESGDIDPETGRTNLGDILISFPTAEKQANEAGHEVENEIILLIVHGILHLTGYDHSSKEEKTQMWQKQQSIMTALGVKINRISGDEEFHD